MDKQAWINRTCVGLLGAILLSNVAFLKKFVWCFFPLLLSLIRSACVPNHDVIVGKNDFTGYNFLRKWFILLIIFIFFLPIFLFQIIFIFKFYYKKLQGRVVSSILIQIILTKWHRFLIPSTKRLSLECSGI